jgi:hypothetical protein
LQKVPVVKNHVVLEEKKSISTTISSKHLGKIPDEKMQNIFNMIRIDLQTVVLCEYQDNRTARSILGENLVK